ncbi:MAG: hypothetical protein B6D58_06625 [candidate division Zixibacteria bacterium 4484_95]|nr:MAG: hypothetical protein B6D58_06625 [candidate division Zixibacteria bacterium 4484_95]
MKRLLLIISIFSIVIGGCIKNPFATRNSQQPVGITGTWETPASSGIVMTNLMFAYNERIIQNFQSCLADNFVFSAPEDSIEAEAQGNGYIYYGWNKEVEVSTTENIFSTFSTGGNHLDLILTESPDYPDSIGDTSAVLYRNYTLRIIESDSMSTDTITTEGLATFRLSQTLFNWWSIYFWKDLSWPSSENSWGDFKADYRR